MNLFIYLLKDELWMPLNSNSDSSVIDSYIFASIQFKIKIYYWFLLLDNDNNIFLKWFLR